MGIEVYLQSAITLHGYDDEVLGSKHISDARPTKIYLNCLPSVILVALLWVLTWSKWALLSLP